MHCGFVSSIWAGTTEIWLAATCRENEKRIFESGLRVDALLLLGGLGGPFSRTEQKPCIKHGCMSYFQRQCQPTERHPQPEKSTARSATIPRVGDPYPSETVSGSREMVCVPRTTKLEHQCLHSWCPHRVHRPSKDQARKHLTVLVAWKLVFYLTFSPPRVEQPEIFQASSGPSIIQICSSVPERELDDTVPLKYVPIGSTVLAPKDIEEGCVIPLSQKRFPQSGTKKQLFDSCSMPASTAATFMRHFASLARTSSWKPHSFAHLSC
jgi:hypothetical protein